MADVTVGTKRIPGGPEFGAYWVRIGDVLLDASEHGLVDVHYEANGESFSNVTIHLTASSFRTVDKDRPEPE